MGRVIRFVLAGVLVVAALAVAGWYFLFRTDAAPKVAIRETPTVASAGSADGTWAVTPGGASVVGYRVTEKLFANVSQTTATGRTHDVSASMAIAGTVVRDVTVTADLRTLQSDKSFRDDRIRGEGLESNRFPQATFVLTEPVTLPSAPAVGRTVDADASGDFTLHGVTKHVTIALQGRWDGRQVQVVGSLPVVFADYGITAPTSPLVASVDDHGTMELQLFFSKR